jgi:hypothetical protein
MISRIKGYVPAFLFCFSIALFAMACCCKDNEPAMLPESGKIPWGRPMGGMACRLVLRQPLISRTLSFNGEIHLKNVSRQVIYIEASKLREEQEGTVSLILNGQRLACSAVEDGLAEFPYEVMEIKPGEVAVLQFSWVKDPGLEDGIEYIWPRPGRYRMKVRLTYPDPKGKILERRLEKEGHALFHGILESNEVVVEIIEQEKPDTLPGDRKLKPRRAASE